MISQAQLIADCFVSLAALAGLCTFMRLIIAGDGADPLARRMLFAMAVLAALMLSRVALWVTDIGIFRFLTLTAAGLIPLSALLLAEGLMRRHAPPRLKWLAAGAAALIFFAAWLPTEAVDPARLIILLALQLGTLAGVGYFVLRRDRASLSAAENASIDRFSLALLVILPLLITDFRIGAFQPPVRMGGIAILLLCWLGVSLSRATVADRDVINSYALLTTAAVVAALTIGAIAQLDLHAVVQVGAIVLSAILLAALYNDSRQIHAERSRDSLLRYLARADMTDQAAFLRGLRDHPLLAGGIMLGPELLEDFDPKILRALFADDPVRLRSDILDEPQTARHETLGWLHERFDATHILLVGHHPFTLFALTLPNLGQDTAALTELRAVQRIAMLIPRKEPLE